MKRSGFRRRSAQISAPLLAAAAAGLLAGCHAPPEMQRCVDEQNRVVAESFCKANGVAPQPAAGGYSNGGSYMGGAFLPRYRYYYGGGGGWNPGSMVYGGGYSSLGGHSYTSSSAMSHSESSGGHVTSGTSRGGFGSTHGGGSGHGGGGE